MLTYNHNIITHNDKWFNEYIGHPEPVYHVYTSGQGGQVIATPNSGKYGTYVTLSNTPASGYVFESYSITGAPWYNRESFYIQHNDAYVEGHFRNLYPPLQPYTLRLQYDLGVTPVITSYNGVQYGSLVQRSVSPNIWDWTYENSNWSGPQSAYSDSSILPRAGSDVGNRNGHNTHLLKILGGNTTGVTEFTSLCNCAFNLNYVALFDTSAATKLGNMFEFCESLESVPLFDTSNADYLDHFICGCVKLTEIPLFDTSNARYLNYLADGTLYGTHPSPSFEPELYSKVATLPDLDISNCTRCDRMFAYLIHVTDGQSITNMYNKLHDKAVAQSWTENRYSAAFLNCGYYTKYNFQTQSDEIVYASDSVRQAINNIPTSWGGLKS